MKGGHVQVKCTDPDCGGTCFACCLAWCMTCGGAEGSLPTECPGVRMTGAQGDAVYDGELDFVGGRWVEKERVK